MMTTTPSAVETPEHVFRFSRNWQAGKRLCGECNLTYAQGNHTEVRVLKPYTSYICPVGTAGDGYGHSGRWSGSQDVPELRTPTDNLCICGATYIEEDAEQWLLSWEMKDPHTGKWRPVQRVGTKHSTHQQRVGLLSLTDEIRNVQLELRDGGD